MANLTAWLDADAAGIARRFDERNGNVTYVNRIEASRALARADDALYGREVAKTQRRPVEMSEARSRGRPILYILRSVL